MSETDYSKEVAGVYAYYRHRQSRHDLDQEKYYMARDRGETDWAHGRPSSVEAEYMRSKALLDSVIQHSGMYAIEHEADLYDLALKEHLERGFNEPSEVQFALNVNFID